MGAYLHHFEPTAILAELPADAWHPAVDAGDKPRDGAWVAEANGYADPSAWPAGSRLILRKERPHPGAQLRITDADRHRVTGFLTNSAGEDLVALELRHRRHVGLRVRDVEFLRRRLSVHENAVQLGVDHAVGPTRGRKARSVPVPAFVLDALSAQCAGKECDDPT